MRFCILSLACLGLASSLIAQTTGSIPAERPRARPPSALTGWADWEKGEALLARLKVPHANILTPEQEQRSFKLAPGYRIELVASEPMVQKPIAFEFDPAGRIWVLEYQGYMRDLAGSHEGEPLCRLVVLEDTDHDGRSDRHTVYLDHLVMPRSFAFVKGGVLLQEPPKLWFCEDSDGDLKCDKRTEVGRMGIPGNPQHTANGLRYGLDNWLHCSDSPKRYRWTREGKLIEQDTVHRGQFGQSFDETGRFYSCYENKALVGDLMPAELLLRNPSLPRDLVTRVSNVFLSAGPAQEVYPIRPTPAVTLGALELREDGRLRTYTIVSGICGYDGDQFPEDARGHFFIPESGGHLIGRLQLAAGIEPLASRFYPAEQEFLASTDERFRPVNARVGPDGALYIADFYHGIIEHIIFMVPWLTQQIQARGLDQGQDLGRLWRIVAEDRPLSRQPLAQPLDKLPANELAKLLDHANGWQRWTAQRLLVERGDAAAKQALTALDAKSALGRLHRLWSLDGLGALTKRHVIAALEDQDERVREAALRLASGHIERAKLQAIALSDSSQRVRLMATLAHGSSAEALPGITAILAGNPSPIFLIAALSGARESQLAWLELAVGSRLASGQSWPMKPEPTDQLITELTRCLLLEDKAESLTRLVALAGIHPPLRGLIAQHAKQAIALPEEPAWLRPLLTTKQASERDMALQLHDRLTWPDKPRVSQFTPSAEPLTEAEQQRLEIGQAAYLQLCAACHQPHGKGAPNLAPPLAGSDWVSGPPQRLARVALQGLYGPVEVSGTTFNLVMPGLGASGLLDDAKLAAILGYIRRAWGNNASLVPEKLVSEVRAQTQQRTLPWTAAELLDIAPAPAAALIKPLANGELHLPARLATVLGQKLAYRPSLDVLAPWRLESEAAEWLVDVPAAGSYEVSVSLAADQASAGDHFSIDTEGSRTTGTVISSGGYDRFVEAKAGQLTLMAGRNRLLLRSDGPLKQELADIRAVILRPAR